ncbi:hypothetical protein ABW20_dc0108497 [Dactylellina cionopaga]|nr:hypothetical protein ABW20_dc0108497 [Dactylellina cionopaga]
MVKVLKHLHSFQGTVPGSLGGGISCGLFWQDDYPNFQTIDQLEDWVNKRARVRSDLSIAIKDCPLVLCHLDVAPRNIIRQNDGTLYLLDWESAGYYPEFFETAALKMTNVNTTKFEDFLLAKVISGLDTSDSKSADAVVEAWCRCISNYL